jgi:anti-sigma factor ChrR (cupin superfamily)
MDPTPDPFTDHISDDHLEACALGRLSEADQESVEVHLLVCEPCRERLVAMETFVSALKNALEASESDSPRVRTASGGHPKV